MTLAAITKPNHYFTSGFVPTRAEASMVTAFNAVKSALIHNEAGMEELLMRLIKLHPHLLIRVPYNTGFLTLTHEIAQNAQNKNTLAVCVSIGGQDVLEVRDSCHLKTPLFMATSYQSLKRLTDLGAKINSCRGEESLLEDFAGKGVGKLESIRCIKHLIRLGACIREKSSLCPEKSKYLESIYQEFLKEIETVRTKIEMVAQHIFIPDLRTIIFDYAIGEEDSETLVYDTEGNYLLDDETEAYQFIRSRPVLHPPVLPLTLIKEHSTSVQ
jgi:hypothetical protein